MRDGRALVVLAIVAASGLCVATVELRTVHSGDSFYRFLIWNLALAWVPFVAALVAYDASRRRVRGAAACLRRGLAPLLPQRSVHADRLHSSARNAHHAALVRRADALGVCLDRATARFASLYLMQIIWRRRVGPALAWLAAVAALALASFGVYLGRFLRFNSWDALVRPRQIAHVIDNDLENPFRHPRLFASLIALTVALTVGYILIYSIARLRLELDSRRRA